MVETFYTAVHALQSNLELLQSSIRIFQKGDIVFSDMGNSDTSARVLGGLEAGSTEQRSLRLFRSAYEESRGGGRIERQKNQQFICSCLILIGIKSEGTADPVIIE